MFFNALWWTACQKRFQQWAVPFTVSQLSSSWRLSLVEPSGQEIHLQTRRATAKHAQVSSSFTAAIPSLISETCWPLVGAFAGCVRCAIRLPVASWRHGAEMANLIEDVPLKGDATRIFSDAICEFIPSLSPMGRQKGWLSALFICLSIGFVGCLRWWSQTSQLMIAP